MEVIRTARLQDLDAIMAIETAAFEPVRRASRRSLRRALHSAWQCVMVCESGGRVAGYAILWPYRHTWRLYSVAIDPAAQGQGIGSRLLVAAIAAARAAGASRMQLEARATPDLLRLYRLHGFNEVARLPDYYAPGDDAVRMRLGL
jgi:ribosomal protein S18 acetylase RimI-like enzyme